jgi:hypothetical protein
VIELIQKLTNTFECRPTQTILARLNNSIRISFNIFSPIVTSYKFRQEEEEEEFFLLLYTNIYAEGGTHFYI